MHLHNHTQYSLLDGLTKVPELMEYVASKGMEAVAITDHGTMSGAIEFYKAATSSGIKPIIGMEAYVAPRGYMDKDSSKDRQYFHLTLLAMNNTGYQNLMRLSTMAHLDGFYYRPRIDRQLLKKYNEGLIVLSGCLGSELGEALQQEQYDQALQTAAWYKETFADRYYIELADHGHPDHPTTWALQQRVNKDLLKIAEELSIPKVVASDAHYLRHEDQEAHEILLCVQTGSFLNDADRFSLKHLELHVADPKDVIKRWGADYPDAITNTKAIADRCNVTLDIGNILIPKFPVPKGESEKSFLHKKVWQGLVWRYSSVSQDIAEKLSIADCKKKLQQKIIERAEYELSVIDSMGFNGYLLIVSDFIIWGKNRGIVFGPGRGSAAGSIICYAIRITELDPMTYDLLFERFLNPDRIAMPDIDIDIQDTRRDEVIEYCVEKYGRERVANIVTFGRMAARNAVRDVARVLEVPYIDADRLAKMIPPPVQGRHIPLKESLKKNQDLKQAYSDSDQNKRVFDLAQKLEGTIRSHGVHAAGVVIAPDDIVGFTPLEMAQKGVVSTQYSMGPVEDLGLLKMDFLGLSNLTIIKNCLRIIERVYGKDINVATIPLDDKVTFELLQKGLTTGVFQLESAGMKRYLKELKPTVFDDIIAMVSLYRPGPMAEIPRFIKGKNNPSGVEFLHPSLKPILKNTFGVLVYQEQIIAMLQLIAGYTPGQADLVRKAIGKKKREIMKAEEPKFIEGCLKQGLNKDQANELWALIQPFADYSFNKSHAACYALIAYQTAYLKAHYPSAFMAALMTSDYDDIDRLAVEISECKNMGINVLPPDINESFHEFGVVPNKKNVRSDIRFGLDAIKNVGRSAVEEIIQAREAHGEFGSIEDFCSSVPFNALNRKSLESLIKTGAFDRFSNRDSLLRAVDSILLQASRAQKEKASGQLGMFGGSEIQSSFHVVVSDEKPTGSNRHYLNWERELLGLYVSRHPLEDFADYLREHTWPLRDIGVDMHGKSVSIGGSISSVRELTTKRGQKMAFIMLSDLSGEVEVTVFPNLYKETPDIWQRDQLVTVRGTITSEDRDGNRENSVKILADSASLINVDYAESYQPTGAGPSAPGLKGQAAPLNSRPKLYIRYMDNSNQTVLVTLKSILDLHSGNTEVVLVSGLSDQRQAIKLPQKINLNDESRSKLEATFGKENVAVR